MKAGTRGMDAVLDLMKKRLWAEFAADAERCFIAGIEPIPGLSVS
jgi:hypothetical protein